MPVLLSLVAAAALSGCKGAVETTGPVPTPNPTQQARILTDTAESKYLSLMTVELGQLVRGQPWFQQLTQAHVDLIAALLRAERAAKAKGETVSIQDMLVFSSEQPWYADGLDEAEARGLKGAFVAYEESLSNRNAPPIGPVLGQALQHGTFRAVDLPQSGEMLVVVSAEDGGTAQTVLDMAVQTLPEIENLVGGYPYDFLHMMVTDLGEYLGGISNDQFIIINPSYINKEVVAHELTHSTLYGTFPMWFEEGFAYFLGYYLSDSMDRGIREATDTLKQLGAPTALLVGPYTPGGPATYFVQSSQGFLFMNAVYELKGIEGLMPLLSKLRTQTMGDQELLREFVQFGTVEEQRAMQDHFCSSVVGTARSYCR